MSLKDKPVLQQASEMSNDRKKGFIEKKSIFDIFQLFCQIFSIIIEITIIRISLFDKQILAHVMI